MTVSCKYSYFEQKRTEMRQNFRTYSPKFPFDNILYSKKMKYFLRHLAEYLYELRKN